MIPAVPSALFSPRDAVWPAQAVANDIDKKATENFHVLSRFNGTRCRTWGKKKKSKFPSTPIFVCHFPASSFFRRSSRPSPTANHGFHHLCHYTIYL